MTRAIYIRNLAIFLLFVVILFATPFLFANEISSPGLIEINNYQMDFYKIGSTSNKQATLNPGDQFLLPKEVTANMVVENGKLNLAATLQNWQALADAGVAPKPFKAPNGKTYYPIKVEKNTNGSLDPKSKSSIGYLNLEEFLEEPSTFGLARTKIPEPEVDLAPFENAEKPISGGVYTDDEVIGYVSESSEQIARPQTQQAQTAQGGSPEETTTEPTPSPYAPSATVSPPTRPEGLGQRPPSNSSQDGFYCDNDWARRPHYYNNNCLVKKYKGDQIKQAQHIMNDLERLNRLREPKLPIDPRFSLCIAYGESGMSPNADSNRGDWGLFQVRDTTGEEAIRDYGSVTPGFTQYNSKREYDAFKAKMVKSTMAQADLHQSVLRMKISIADLRDGTTIAQRLGNGTMRKSDYAKWAKWYNAGKNRTRYGNAKANCWEAMTKLADPYGRFYEGVTHTELAEALLKSKP